VRVDRFAHELTSFPRLTYGKLHDDGPVAIGFPTFAYLTYAKVGLWLSPACSYPNGQSCQEASCLAC